jgi:tRNA A37 threonylcarbamoyladenosine dehydratase
MTVCGGAGGRRDGTQVRVMDLSRVIQDRLSSEVRKRLRKEHGFPRNEKKFGIDCVCSPEPPMFPRKDGTVCAIRESTPDGESLRLNCDWGFGSATFVTGVFGLVAAGHAVGKIAGISSHAP